MKEKKHLLEGSINRSIFVLSVPIIFAMFLQIIYSITDTFWVGRVSADAVAAISLSFPILFILTSFSMGFATAGTILVSQYFGKKDYEKISYISSQTIFNLFFISAILSLLGYFFSDFLVYFIGGEGQVAILAINYLKISFLGLVFTFFYMGFQSLMRGIGEVKFPFYLVFGTVILNFILDPIFILGWFGVNSFGVGGAALVTVFCQGIACFVGLFVLIKGKYHIFLSLKDFYPRLKTQKKLFILGIPSSIEKSLTAVGMLLMTILVAKFGTASLAAFGIGTRILSFAIILGMGLSIAITTLIGQNIGAKQIDRAKEIYKKGILFGFIVSSIMGVILFIFAESITSFFVPTSPETILVTTFFIKVMSLSLGFLGIQIVVSGAFKGGGRTGISMFLSLFHTSILFVSAFILSIYFEEKGIWFAYPVANFLAGMFALAWIKFGRLHNENLVED